MHVMSPCSSMQRPQYHDWKEAFLSLLSHSEGVKGFSHSIERNYLEMSNGEMSVEELTDGLSALQVDTEEINGESSSADSELHTDELATSSLSSVSMSSDISYYILDWRSKATPSSVS